MADVDEVSGVAYYGAVAGFTKLFSTIVDSTVWREEMHVKVVWITMLAKANRNGDVLASVPGLADAARVSLDQCVEALARLSAPDTWSRTKEYEGRRIVEVDGGWRLLNYPKYRKLRDADERRMQTREAVRRYRAKEKANPITVSTSKHGKPRKAQAEAEAEAEAETTTTCVEPKVSTPRKKVRGANGWSARAIDIWRQYQGEPVAGKLGSALKPLVVQHGADEVLRRFAVFAQSADARFGFHHFREHFNTYDSDALAGPAFPNHPPLEWVRQ